MPLRVWKRDARCFFDQLAAPESLYECLGRPGLCLRELLDCHLASDGREPPVSMEEMQRFCFDLSEVHLDDYVFPCCATWPMGFSWSSYLAQSTLLAQCAGVGLSTDRMLADDLLRPSTGTLRFACARAPKR